MEKELPFFILPQPTETTCGPTCLHAVYNYYRDPISLPRVIEETPSLDEGGTLGVFLACHALRRGYKVTIYTYNLHIFDPTWFGSPTSIETKLREQAQHKEDRKLQAATNGYIDFLRLGGKIAIRDLHPSLIRYYLKRGIPIVAGLSATYLFRSAREYGPKCDYNDTQGEPSGHFVVLSGYNKIEKTVSVAEPLHPNPLASTQYYRVDIHRLICAILLGIITYDANLIIIEETKAEHGKSHRRK